MGSKEKKSKKEKSKDKHKSKDKKSKKEKRSKKQRHGSSSPSDSSSSGSDGEHFNVNTQLRMGRAAAKATREILAYNHDLRKELRELVRQLDGGGALDVSGIPDDFLRSRLLTLFDNLVQLRKNSAGQYFKRKDAGSTVLSFVAPLLEETPDMLVPYRQASQQHAAAEQGAQAAAVAAEAAAQAAAAAPPAGEQQQQQRGPKFGAAGPPPREQQQQQQQRQQQEGLVQSDSSEGEEEQQEETVGCAAGPIGPAGFPPAAAAAAAAAATAAGEERIEEEVDIEEDAGIAGRRAAGPAMPPAEWLAAAAQMEYPVSDEEPELDAAAAAAGGVEAGGHDDEFMVGPPPPEIAEELDLASMDDRTAEVVRVLRVLQLHATEHAKSSSAKAAEQPVDAYEVLGGVEPDTPPGEVKKRYWRVSLLIHPDKCDHPQANEAFQAVTAAAKELQDTALRAAVDERRQEAEMRREFAATAAKEERERQWRIARGQATPADLAGPVVPAGPLARDTWMTELPPERMPNATPAPPSGPVLTFSRAGIKSRGDTSAWTMTPQQRAAQLENGSAGGGSAGAGGGPLLLATAGAGGGGGARGSDRGVASANPVQAARMAAAVDAFNSQIRKKTLMEIHAERRAGGDKKQRKKQKTEGGASGKKAAAAGGAAVPAAAADVGYDPEQHPWRPFDREKDMGPGLDAKTKASDLLKGERALSSKFGGGQGGGRTFL